MSVKSTVQAIKDAGFGYVKVELEAQLDRPYDNDEGEYVTCGECYGDGHHSCDTCDGEGYTEVELTRPDGSTSDITEEITCDDCYGDGHIDCSECEGSGEVYEEYDSDGEFGSVQVCEDFIMDNISKEAKEALIYGRFYNDGSVDSEYTFTIPVEKVNVLPEFINSFNKLAEAVGNGMDVDGAGMHIAVLPTESNGRYPVPSTVGLNPEGLQNFTTEVTKLLPALFIAATSGNFTRDLNYRNPKIERDKYSAIHVVNGRCLEFRLFETCYQRPEAVFEFLETISRTLEYYKDPSKKVEVQGKEFVFYDREGLRGFTSTPDQVRIIKKQLKMVIGKNVTLKSFAQARELDLSVQTRNKDFAKRLSRTRKMYKEALADFQHRVSRPLTSYEREQLRDNEDYGYYEGRDWTMEQKIAYVRSISDPGTEEQFINRNILNMRMATAISV